MVLELSLKDLYAKLIEDPDLRRLGPYKIVAAERQSIFPIDVDCEGQQVHLGEGDFTDGFVAFCSTKAQGIDFGDAKFTDLYLDFLETDYLTFAQSQASRLYFDDAKIKECHFGDFTAPEVYFDTAIIEATLGENLQAGIIYVEASTAHSFELESLVPHAHRVTLDGGKLALPGETSDSAAEVRVVGKNDFLRFLAEDGDLRRLGAYRVVLAADEDEELTIELDIHDAEINFGQGDFTALRVSFAETRVKTLDFANSNFSDVDMRESKVENCFFDEFSGRTLQFGSAEITNVFCETGSAQGAYLENLRAGQFNVNNLETAELRLGRARVGEMFLSRGEGVQRMYGELAELNLLNLHEGRLQELDFGQARIEKALINKAHIEIVRAEGLIADKLYIGNDGTNEIGKLELGLQLGIRELDLEKALPRPDGEGRLVIGEISRFNH